MSLIPDWSQLFLCFGNEASRDRYVGRSVGRSVCLSVCLSVDFFFQIKVIKRIKRIKFDYLIFLNFLGHITS